MFIRRTQTRNRSSGEPYVTLNWPPKNGRHEVYWFDFVEVV